VFRPPDLRTGLELPESPSRVLSQKRGLLSHKSDTLRDVLALDRSTSNQQMNRTRAANQGAFQKVSGFRTAKANAANSIQLGAITTFHSHHLTASKPIFRDGEPLTNSKQSDRPHARVLAGGWLGYLPPIYSFSRLTLRANQSPHRPTSNTTSGGPNSTTASNQ